MTINAMIANCPSLTEEIIFAAYDQCIRMIRLQPLVLTVTTNTVRLTDLTDDYHVLVDASGNAVQAQIKQVLDIICEERLDTLPELDTSILPDISMDYGICSPTGKVYLSNNSIATPGGAKFMLLCYCMPMILVDEEDFVVPDHLVILTTCKALAMLAEQNGDVASVGRYEAVLSQLVNSYNRNFVEMLPSSLTRGFKLNASSI